MSTRVDACCSEPVINEQRLVFVLALGLSASATVVGTRARNVAVGLKVTRTAAPVSRLKSCSTLLLFLVNPDEEA